MATDLDTELSEKLLCDRADGDAGRRFSRGRAFENVSKIACAELLSACEVGVAGPRACNDPLILSAFYGLFSGIVDGLRRHDFLPVDEVAILDHQCDRGTERLAVT